MQANPIQICPACLGTRREPDIPCRRPIPCPRCDGRGHQVAASRAQSYTPTAALAASYATAAEAADRSRAA